MMLDGQQREQLERQLRHATREMNIEVNDLQVSLLLDYLAMLFKWNKAYNLTAIRQINDMLHRHIIDSLSVVKHVHGERLIDVGTGGGLPGVVLAILYPERSIVLLDSNGKKTRFLFQVKAELGLKNIEVVNKRVEQFTPEVLFDGIISRAFSSLQQMYHWTNHLLAENGCFFAMKGVYNQTEIDELPAGLSCECIDLFVPNEEGQRHLVIITTN